MTAVLDRPVSSAPPARSPRRSHRDASSRPSATIAVNGLLIVGSAYMILPLLWLVFAVSKSAAGLFDGSPFTFGDSFITNVTELIAEGRGIFLRWLANSFLYAVVGAVAGGFISIMAGYAFDKFDFRGKRALYGAVLIGVLIPNTATVIPLYLLAASAGITNTIWGVIIPALCNPFSVYLARIFSAGYLPGEVLEAARVDGAGPIRSFLSVALPMIMPGFITIALFQFVSVWNNFMLPLIMLQNRELFPSSVGIFLWQSQVQQNPDFATLVIAGSLLSVVPLLIAFIGLQRFWRAGLSAGSVK